MHQGDVPVRQGQADPGRHEDPLPRCERHVDGGRQIGTGVAVAIPEGFAGFVHPRSGLAHRLGLSLVNAPGTIDAGYRGEIKVNLINLDPTTPLSLRRGDRIAQLVVQPVVRARFVPVAELPDSERGTGGHGSTGGAPAPAPVERAVLEGQG